jgi:hypothetical protein
MRDEATKFFKSEGFRKADDADAHHVRGPPQYMGGSFPNFPTPQGREFPHAPQGGGFPQGFGGQQGGPAKPPAFVPSTFAPQGGMNG